MSAQLEDGYTRVANELLDKLIKIHLNGNEWSILHCVMRQTWGWRKKEDKISFTQFQKFTELNRSSVNKAIKSLVAKQILVAKQQPVGNVYQIQKDYSKWTSCRIDTSCRFATTPVAKQQPVAFSSKVVAKQQPTKEIYKETIQKKERLSIYELNDTHFEIIAQKYNVPISFVRSEYDDMINWHESTGKRKKDWIATLRNFVKKDSVKLRMEHNDRSKIIVSEI